MGTAATGWKAVAVQTRNFADGQLRPVIVYIPSRYVERIVKVA
jgi:hypothetical protein